MSGSAPTDESAPSEPAKREADGSIQTVSGRWIDPLDPDPAEIVITDIAQALANQCRFGGHSRSFYSVAQHCCIVTDTCVERGASSGAALNALLHDAGEAYLVDLPHPLKHRSPLGPPYREAEARLEEAIRVRFELDPAFADLKLIDRCLLATERRTFASSVDTWPELEGFEPLEIAIEPWDPTRAKSEFLARFEELDAQRRGG
jgi:hypothetical protein